MKRIFSFILALMAVQMMWAAQITVTNTSDDVEEEGSLRWACATATAEDTIVFKFRKKIGNVIHIKSSLSTVASIDGSTWADSIIIDGYDEEKGTKANFGGLSGTGPFVKNIIVQNCYNGITPSSGSILYNCIARNCTTDGFYSTKTQTTYIRCKSLNNGGNGIQFTDQGTKGFVEDCDITGNGNIGLWGARSVKNSRICDNKKYGICIKYSSEIASEISDCIISGNDSIGILLEHSVNLISNNIIGLNSDQVTPNPNGYGIYVYNGRIDSVKNNIISGNRLDGVIDMAGRSGIENFVGNYVGTNSSFSTDPSLGNGKNCNCRLWRLCP